MAGSGVAASLFLQEVMEEAEQLGNGPQAVTKASAALTALHSIAGSVSPSSDPLCGVVREVAKRSLIAQPLNREPIFVSELKRLVDVHLGPKPHCKRACTLHSQSYASKVSCGTATWRV